MFLEDSGLGRTDSLRRVMCSGEALPVSLQDRFHERIQSAELHNLYGPTEAAVDVTFWACRRNQPVDSVPIGRPIANTQIYVLDQLLQPVPVGVTGELYIGGVGVGRGYMRRPALTAEKFIPDPFSSAPGARMYRTGDLACFRPDGAIVYLGRTDHQVKIRGFRIELGEIETALAQHTAIREAVVLADGSGPMDTRLVAYTVSDTTSPSAAELRAFLRNSLPDYMVPSAFVALDVLPTTPNGKLDRRALPSPDGGRSDTESTYVAPTTDLERSITAVWREVLQVDRVGIRDNFFDLGGHSLLIIQVQSRLSQMLARDVDLVELFNHPNVEMLAAYLSAVPDEAEAAPVAAIEEGKARLKQRLSRMKSVVAYEEGDD
jgi:AMP-binding enzyme/Phosphopantetheine attachment site/AMP-binding enzyme C-terminal domain